MDSVKSVPERGKYDLSRHHAWAGLALLSIVLAVRLLFPSIPDPVENPLILILIVYAGVSLLLTYRYRASLREQADRTRNVAAEPVGGKEEKERFKAEKKRIKAEIKARKKQGR